MIVRCGNCGTVSDVKADYADGDRLEGRLGVREMSWWLRAARCPKCNSTYVFEVSERQVDHGCET